MLKRARHGLLNLKEVNSLNAQVVTHLPNSNFADTIIIVQKNKTRHLINCLQAENFACSYNMNFILFPAEHSRNKKDRGNLIQHKDLLGVQEGEKNAASPKILYYCKKMPAIVLTNQCTLLGIVNGVKVIIYGVVSHPQGICFLIQTKFEYIIKSSYLPTNQFFYHSIFLSTTLYITSKATSFESNISWLFGKGISTLSSKVYYVFTRDKY